MKAGRAGTLEIELITNVAKLQKEVRDIRASIRGMTDEAGAGLGAVNDNFAKFGRGATGVVRSAGQMRSGMQQLGYQLSDVTTMWSLGAKPMQIFASQSGQIIQSLQLMTNSSKGFLGVLAGPWGLVITAALTVLVPLVMKLWEGEDATKAVALASDGLSDAQGVMGKMFDTTTGKIKDQSDALRMNAQLMAMNLRNEAMKASADARSAANNAGQMSWGELFSSNTPLWMMSQSRQTPQRKLLEDVIAGRTSGSAAQATAMKMDFSKVDMTKLEFMKALVDATEASLKNMTAAQIEASLASGKLADGLIDKDKAAAAAKREAAAGEREAAKAAREAAKAQRELDQELKQILTTLDPAAARAYEYAKALEKIADLKSKGALGASPDENSYMAAKLSQALDNSEIDARLRDRMSDISYGLQQAFKSELDVNLDATLSGFDKAMEKSGETVRQALGLGASDIVGAAQAFSQIIGGGIGGFIDKILGTINQFDALFSALNMGSSFKSGMKSIFAPLKDSITKLGDKIFGAAPGGAAGVFSAAGSGAAIGAVGDSLLGAIGIKSSKTGAMLGGALGGVAGLVAGGGAAASLGASLGIAAGPAGIIAGAVIGTLVGGILGGMLKKTKKGSSTLGLSNGALNIASTVGNSASRKDASIQMGNSLIEAMQQFATQLGGTANGTISTSIGMRNKKYVVDTTGQGRTKGAGVLSFTDQAEAVKAALADALKDGIITGIHAGAQNLLKAGGDIEKQMEKALAFENVFKDLEAATNPLAQSLTTFKQKFVDLKAIFDEAGASAEEYAALQKLQAVQLQQLLDQAGANYRSNFYTDEENIAYAKKTISSVLTPLGKGAVDTVAEYRNLVDGLDLSTEAGQTLYGTLMDLSDEFATLQAASEAAAAAADQLAQQKLGLEIQLLRLQGKEVEATAKAREAELAAMDPTLRALQQQVYLWTDISDARSVLTDAYNRESDALTATSQKFKQFSDTLKEFRSTLFTTDASANAYRAAQVRLMMTGGLAVSGDEKALGDLPGVSRDFLDVAKENASSLLQYQRDVAMVARYVDGAIATADGQVSVADQQLDQLKQSVTGLIDLNQNVVSVHDAIVTLTGLLAQTTPQAAAAAAAGAGLDTQEQRDARERRMEERTDRMERVLTAGLVSQNRLHALMNSWNRGGAMAVTSDEDAPVLTANV